MRKTIHDAFKYYMREAFINKRTELGISQEEMADILFMSTRGYVGLERMYSACGLTTLIIFCLVFYKSPADRNAFLDDLFDVIELAMNGGKTT